MDSIVLCYAPADEGFARHLAGFLEANLPFAISLNEAVIDGDVDLLEAADRALSAQVALILLSPHSVPRVWNRKIWEPLFFQKPAEFQTLLGFVLVSACQYPALLGRERFFDACADGLQAERAIKRWLIRPGKPAGPAIDPPPELEGLRHRVADRPGSIFDVSTALAVQFAESCAADFEAVYRFDCRGRSRAGIIGDIGSALGLPFSGRLTEDRAALLEWCGIHRVLLLLAGVNAEDREFAAPAGRSSTIFTAPPANGLPGSIPGAGAAVRGFEAECGADIEAALRLGWHAVNLLKTQGRLAEVSEVLEKMAPLARERNDAIGLVRIEREKYWMQVFQDDESAQLSKFSSAAQEQLAFAFMGERSIGAGEMDGAGWKSGE